MMRMTIALLLGISGSLTGQGIQCNQRPIPRTVLRIPKDLIAKSSIGAKVHQDPISGIYHITWIENGRVEKCTYDPPNRIDPVVCAKVSKHGEAFTYLYVLRNLPSSAQAIQHFRLQVLAPISEVETPDQWHFLKPTTVNREEGLWCVWSVLAKFTVSPGHQQDHIGFSSTAPPGIVECYLESKAGRIQYPRELPEEIWGVIDGFSSRWNVGSRGKTVGPVEVKGSPDPRAFLENISKMMDESLELGWVDGPATRDALKQALEKSARLIESKEPEKAKAEMRQAIALVEEGLDKTVTSEVQAIVKYNLEFLIQRIK